VKVSFGVPDYALRQLHLGQEFMIRLQDDPKGYQGRVTSISPSADERNRVFTVEVTVSNRSGSLKPGMIASITLRAFRNLPFLQCPLAPSSHILHNPVGFAVMVAQQRSGKWTASLREVQLGATHDTSIGVVE